MLSKSTAKASSISIHFQFYKFYLTKQIIFTIQPHATKIPGYTEKQAHSNEYLNSDDDNPIMSHNIMV